MPALPLKEEIGKIDPKPPLILSFSSLFRCPGDALMFIQIHPSSTSHNPQMHPRTTYLPLSSPKHMEHCLHAAILAMREERMCIPGVLVRI